VSRLQLALDGFKRDDVPALFWTANAWASYINLNIDDVRALADIPKVQLIMRRVLDLDETYYYGGPHLFYGILAASRAPTLGGEPLKAREHFEACLRINEHKFLLAKYFYARTYAVQVQDRELFCRCLQDILADSSDSLPELRLANKIAKKKACHLLARADDLFL
jgi:hypothetical protein